jgi:nitroimidazol reductase NimA-like FMN-containing flavoprotein (pyridoxamine 5'-phosphate oxidase superfamily)
VVTLSYGFDEVNGDLFFHAAKEGQKIDMLRSNPAVCLTIIEDNGYIPVLCSHAYRTIVIRGNMEFVDDASRRLKAVTFLIDHFKEDVENQLAKVNQGSDTWENTQMLKLHIREISGKKRGTLKE